MTTDERLDKLESIVVRLAERTEALSHSVELLAGMQIETEKRMTLLADVTTRLEESVARVVTVLVSHEERLDTLEGNRPRQ